MESCLFRGVRKTMPTDHSAPLAVDLGRKTNVLIVASSLWIGGAESVIQHLAMTLDRRRFNVTVCCLKQRGHIGDEIASAGIDIVSLGEGDHPKDRGKVDYFSFRKLEDASGRQVTQCKVFNGYPDQSLAGMADGSYHFTNLVELSFI